MDSEYQFQSRLFDLNEVRARDLPAGKRVLYRRVKQACGESKNRGDQII